MGWYCEGIGWEISWMNVGDKQEKAVLIIKRDVLKMRHSFGYIGMNLG